MLSSCELRLITPAKVAAVLQDTVAIAQPIAVSYRADHALRVETLI